MFMLYKLTTNCRRFSLAILPVLLVAITALTPLAFASPPDPSWVQGIYDDADFDDVVVFIASGAAVVEVFLRLDLRLVLPLTGHTAPAEPDAVLASLPFIAPAPRPSSFLSPSASTRRG